MIVSMEVPKQRNRHEASQLRLAQKGMKIDGLQNPYLDISQLKEYGIYVCQVSLDDAEHFPRYFHPMTPEKFASLEDRRCALPRLPQPGDIHYDDGNGNRPRKNYKQARYKGAALQEQLCPYRNLGEEGPNLLEATSWNYKGYWEDCAHELIGDLDMSPEEYPQEWRLNAILDTAYTHRPHLACILYQGVENIGPLLRSELLTIFGVIVDQMRSEWSETHLTFPLLVISMIGTQERILQAHWDGDKLYIQYSQLYEFKAFDKDNVDLFLRWLMNEPIGDTAIIAPEGDTELGSIHKSPSKKIGNRLEGHFGISLAA